MGASILPVTVYKGKIYFLFGKEREFDENPGWSDFGGGTDNNESFLDTAIREGGEELTGFLGSSANIKQMLTKYGTFPIDYKATGFGIYRVHIFPMVYDEFLPHYYNNNQQFLQKRLSRKIIKDAKIFEKTEIRWICFDEIIKMKKEFRSFYQNIVDLILNRRDEISAFVRKHLKSDKKTRIKRSKPVVKRSNKRSKTMKKR
jgi:hypothetical protein